MGFSSKKQIQLWLAIVFLALSLNLSAQSLFTPSLPSGLKVNRSDRYFLVTPRIVPADKESTIRIIARYEIFPKPGYTYRVVYTPVGRYALQTGWKKPAAEPVVPKGNFLKSQDI